MVIQATSEVTITGLDSNQQSYVSATPVALNVNYRRDSNPHTTRLSCNSHLGYSLFPGTSGLLDWLSPVFCTCSLTSNFCAVPDVQGPSTPCLAH